MLTSALAGPLAGVVTGLVSQLVRSLYEGFIWLPFGAVQVLIALVAGLAAARHGFRSPGRSLAWGVAAGLAAEASLSGDLVLRLQGRHRHRCDGRNTSADETGARSPQAVTVSSVGTDLLDKTIVFGLVGAILRALPLRVLGRYPWARRALAR